MGPERREKIQGPTEGPGGRWSRVRSGSVSAAGLGEAVRRGSSEAPV